MYYVALASLELTKICLPLFLECSNQSHSPPTQMFCFGEGLAMQLARFSLRLEFLAQLQS